jgi:uncharacterized membrane protein
MDAVTVIVRSVHVLAGVFWVGTVFFLFAFLGPVARSPEGVRMIERLAPRFGPALGIAGGLTILSGLGMYWRDSQGFRLEWILSPTGLTFTIGAVAALVAAALGGTMLRASGLALAEIGAQVGAGAPSAEQRTRMEALTRRLAAGSASVTALLTVAVIAMASARYV